MIQSCGTSLRADIEELYKDADGCLFFHNFRQLTLGQALEAVEELRVNATWYNNYMPIGRLTNEKGKNEYLIVDGEGTVVAWEVDEGILEKVSDSLQSYLGRLVAEISGHTVSYKGAELGYRK